MVKYDKIAKITILFWLLKIVATTLGETFGDFLSMSLKLGYSKAFWITFIILIIALVIQLKVKRYIPVIFWLTIIGTTTTGTEISDYIDRVLGIGYVGGSLLLFSCLMATLMLWRVKFKDNKVYPIYETEKEVYFWVAVLFSNSLGTAFGDFLSDVVGLSYIEGAAVTLCIILVAILIDYLGEINETVLFWIAFIFTRPFGATFGDFLTKPVKTGGLHFGRLDASLIELIVFIALLLIEYRRLKKDGQNKITLE